MATQQINYRYYEMLNDKLCSLREEKRELELQHDFIILEGRHIPTQLKKDLRFVNRFIDNIKSTIAEVVDVLF